MNSFSVPWHAIKIGGYKNKGGCRHAKSTEAKHGIESCIFMYVTQLLVGNS